MPFLRIFCISYLAYVLRHLLSPFIYQCYLLQQGLSKVSLTLISFCFLFAECEVEGRVKRDERDRERETDRQTLGMWAIMVNGLISAFPCMTLFKTLVLRLSLSSLLGFVSFP